MDLNLPVAVIDLETTGLDPERHEIIEIGAYVMAPRTLEKMFELELKVFPAHIDAAEKKALEVNGYDPRVWEASAVYPRQALRELVRLLEPKAVFAAYNATFDWCFLSKALSTCGLKDPFHYHRLDVMSLAVGVHPELIGRSGFRLGEMLDLYKVENEKAHAALPDARATAELLRRLVRGWNPETGSY